MAESYCLTELGSQEAYKQVIWQLKGYLGGMQNRPVLAQSRWGSENLTL